MSVDLSTKYLGLTLKNPLVVAACSLTDDLENIKKMEAAGASAIVMHSLFEEQIEHEQEETQKVYEHGAESFAEAMTYFPELDDYRLGPESYIEHVEKAKKAVSVPLIASLNGTTSGGWVRYAKLLEEAGADALELNVYLIAADIDVSGQEVEKRYLDLVAAVKETISIPLAVKVGPSFSSPGHMAKQLSEAGADGLVLFNRFLQPDIKLDDLSISPHLVLSTANELLMPLRWIAILRGRVEASLALTSGIHGPNEMVKAILAGADVGMVASTLYKNGIDSIGQILAGTEKWLADNEYESVLQAQGSMSQANCPEPAAFERGNYMKALTSFTGEFI